MTQLQHPDGQQLFWRDASMSFSVATTDDYSVTPRTLIAGLAGHVLHIAFIQPNILTTGAFTQTFQSITTDVRVAVIPSGITVAGASRIPFDFHPGGFALPEGEGLELINTGAGMAFNCAIEAYFKPGATLVAKTATMTSGYNTL